MLKDPNDEGDPGHQFGSALNPNRNDSMNPGNIHGQGEKEIARPGVQIDVKTNNRAATGGAIIDEEAMAAAI
jgi:hypothetical protein